MSVPAYSVFEYLYRDAANYKAFGKLLLQGATTSHALTIIQSKLDPGDLFVANQVGVPALHEQLWKECGAGFDPEFDHPWHEFVALRPATSEEVAALELFATVAELTIAFGSIKGWRAGEIHAPLT